MQEKRSEHPAFKVAGVVSVLVFLIVLMLAVFAKEYLVAVEWIARTGETHGEFRKQCGSVNCVELIACDLGTGDGQRSFVEQTVKLP